MNDQTNPVNATTVKAATDSVVERQSTDSAPSAPPSACSVLSAALPNPASPPSAPPRLRCADRQQQLPAMIIDELIEPDHPARAVWRFVETLELSPLYDAIRSRLGSDGRSAIDPLILLALWLYATLDGILSARRLAKLCQRDHPYRWLAGGIAVNYHTLADFRVDHLEFLEYTFEHSVEVLRQQGFVKLDRVAQDGMRVRASAGAASFRRRETLEKALEDAQAEVDRLDRQLQETAQQETAAPQQAAGPAVETVATQRVDTAEPAVQQEVTTEPAVQQEVAAASLAVQHEQAAASPQIQQEAIAQQSAEPGDEQQTPTTRQGKAQQRAAFERLERVQQAIERLPEMEAKKKPDEKQKARVSTTDPQATVMKMGDGGFRPAYNFEYSTDTVSQVIVGVEVVTEGSDQGQVPPMLDQIEERFEKRPEEVLVDGGCANHHDVEKVQKGVEGKQGCRVYSPVPKPKKEGVDRYAPHAGDSEEVAEWRARMATDTAKEIYKERASTAECVNAQARNRGLIRVLVRGLQKVKAIALWIAIAHNVARGFALLHGYPLGS